MRRILALSALLVLPGCDIQVNDKGVSIDIAEGRATDEWSRRYTIAAGGSLEIGNVNGPIQVVPATAAEVEVTASRRVNAASTEQARAFLQAVEMVEETAPDRVSVQARVERGEEGGAFGQRPQLHIEYLVKLPPGLNASFKTENGGVRLENVEGTLAAASTNGGVTSRGISGSFKASTVNGGLQIDMARVAGDVEVTTVNGGIRLELPAGVNGNLEARAVNGGVSVDDRFTLASAERERLRVSGRLNAGGPRIAAQTTNGGVRVVVRGDGPAPDGPPR